MKLNIFIIYLHFSFSYSFPNYMCRLRSSYPLFNFPFFQLLINQVLAYLVLSTTNCFRQYLVVLVIRLKKHNGVYLNLSCIFVTYLFTRIACLKLKHFKREVFFKFNSSYSSNHCMIKLWIWKKGSQTLFCNPRCNSQTSSETVEFRDTGTENVCKKRR